MKFDACSARVVGRLQPVEAHAVVERQARIHAPVVLRVPLDVVIEEVPFDPLPRPACRTGRRQPPHSRTGSRYRTGSRHRSTKLTMPFAAARLLCSFDGAIHEEADLGRVRARDAWSGWRRGHTTCCCSRTARTACCWSARWPRGCRCPRTRTTAPVLLDGVREEHREVAQPEGAAAERVGIERVIGDRPVARPEEDFGDQRVAQGAGAPTRSTGGCTDTDWSSRTAGCWSRTRSCRRRTASCSLPPVCSHLPLKRHRSDACQSRRSRSCRRG